MDALRGPATAMLRSPHRSHPIHGNNPKFRLQPHRQYTRLQKQAHAAVQRLRGQILPASTLLERSFGACGLCELFHLPNVLLILPVLKILGNYLLLDLAIERHGMGVILRQSKQMLQARTACPADHPGSRSRLQFQNSALHFLRR
jgi:hypothetical protein